jgi:hypothetical protein
MMIISDMACVSLKTPMLFCRIGKHTEKRCRSSRDAMPKSTFTPTHTENARAISDGKREGKAFVTTLDSEDNPNTKATAYLNRQESSLIKLYGKHGYYDFGITFLGPVQSIRNSKGSNGVAFNPNEN